MTCDFLPINVFVAMVVALAQGKQPKKERRRPLKRKLKDIFTQNTFDKQNRRITVEKFREVSGACKCMIGEGECSDAQRNKNKETTEQSRTN